MQIKLIGVKLQHITKSEIYFDGDYYCARCLDSDVFTQGNTFDEVMENLQEAVSLHLEDDLIEILK